MAGLSLQITSDDGGERSGVLLDAQGNKVADVTDVDDKITINYVDETSEVF